MQKTCGGPMKKSFSHLHRFVQFFVISVITLTSYNNCSQPSHLSNSSSSSSNIQQVAFKCTDRNLSSKTKNFVLSKNQYVNTIEDLFGSGVLSAVSSELSTILPDSNDADTFARLSTISPAQANAYYDTAIAIANYVLTNTNRTATVFGSCANQTTPNSTCINTYINGYAKKILRRPLNSSEISFANQMMTTSGTYKENLKFLLAYHLISPSFLWLIELGTQSVSSNKVLLSSYEVATRLSYLITDSTPDDSLLTAAMDGSLMTPLGLQNEVQRLIKSPRGKLKITKNLLRWALADRVQDFSGLPSPLLGNLQTSGLQAAMLTEAESFTDYIVHNNLGSLKELLTSKISFAAHPGLASIYGHAPMVSNPVLMSDRRQGLLMKAPFLTWYTARSNIIMRGVKFQKRVLCNEIPPPNVDIANNRNMHVLTAQELLTVTNRAAVTYQTDSPLCMSCHKLINPVGFAFENFDSLGRIRTQESIFDTTGAYVRSLPVSSSTTVPMPSGSDLSVGDAFDLVSQIADSKEVSACVTKNMYRYFYEKKETSEDDCQLQNSFEVVSDSQKSILESIEKLFTAQTIYYKEI